MTAERLYGTNDMARALGTTAGALINRRTRNGPQSIVPPDPAYVHGKHNMPLWTREQLEACIAERIAHARTVLDGHA